MSMYRSICLSFLLFSCATFAQDKSVALSVQQGHSGSIRWVDISADSRLLATYGTDLKIVIWDLRAGNQLTFFYSPTEVTEISFGKNNLTLYFKNSTGSFIYNIVSGNCQVAQSAGARKLSLATAQGNVEIAGSKITLTDSYGQRLKTQTSNYTDQGFTAIAYSPQHGEIYAACLDGSIYVYNENLKFKSFLKGHLNDVNDLVVSPDEHYLYSASADRSVIEWDLETKKSNRRLSGKSYATYGVSLSSDGLSVYFGDETGYLKQLSLDNASLDLQSVRKSIYPITFSAQPDSTTVIFSGDDNRLIKQNNNRKKVLDRAVNLTPRLVSHKLIVDAFGLYKDNYSSFYDVEISPDMKRLVYFCYARGFYFPYYRVLDLETGKKSSKLFLKGHTQFNEPVFINDSIFCALDLWEVEDSFNDNDTTPCNAITLWKITNDKKLSVFEKKIRLGTTARFVEKLNNHAVAIITSTNNLAMCDLNSGTQATYAFDSLNYIYFLKDNLVAGTDKSHALHIFNFDKGNMTELGVLEGHQDFITSCEYDAVTGRAITSSRDATVRIWDIDSMRLLLTIIPIGADNAIYITPDNYYMTTSKELNSFGFNVNGNYFYPEQFDAVFNRPDVVLERLGYVDSLLISAYHQAYLKRIEKLGFTEEMLKTDFHLPEIEIANESVLLANTSHNDAEMELKITDTKYLLDRINVYVNDVAVFGTNGISVKDQNTQSLEKKIVIPLAYGLNKIQVSVVNQAGAESYKSTVTINSSAGGGQADLYMVTIGCSKFKDSRYDLNYAAKDAEDLALLFKENKIYNKINSKQLLNADVTIENVIALREFFKPANINDEVIIFFAGHGVLDKELDYYLASHDMDFTNPAGRGIPYSAIENLVDGIAPLKKLIFIDACHSGEVDKTEIEFKDGDENSENNNEDLTFRKVGNSVQQKENPMGLQSTSQLTKSLFADLRKGTGATVISSAGGMEFAIESNEWQNGLFTYCLLQGIKTKKADLDKDGKIMLTELQAYVGEQVLVLSGGRQQPTSRIENNSINYRIW